MQIYFVIEKHPGWGYMPYKVTKDECYELIKDLNNKNKYPCMSENSVNIMFDSYISIDKLDLRKLNMLTVYNKKEDGFIKIEMDCYHYKPTLFKHYN